MSATPEAIRSRSIRHILLRMLNNLFHANPGVGLEARYIYDGFSGGMVATPREEIDIALIDLIEDGLVTCEDGVAVAPPLPKVYRITGKGRDFWRAACPWEKVDEFSGDQKL